jgi:hypothetical protein
VFLLAQDVIGSLARARAAPSVITSSYGDLAAVLFRLADDPGDLVEAVVESAVTLDPPQSLI